MSLKSVGTEFSAVLEAAVSKDGGSYPTPIFIQNIIFASADRDVIESTPYYIYIYIYIYIFVCVCVCVCVYAYMNMNKKTEDTK